MCIGNCTQTVQPIVVLQSSCVKGLVADHMHYTQGLL